MTRLLPYRFPLALAFAALYNVFFWQESLGLNLPLFSLLTMGLILVLNPAALLQKNVWMTALGTLLTGFLVVFYHSGTAKVVHIASFFLFAGFVHQPQVRSVLHALRQLLDNYLHLGTSLREEWSRIWQLQPGYIKVLNYLKLVGIPLAVFTLFYLLFSLANPRFAQMSEDFFGWIGAWFEDLSFGRFFFLLSGFVIGVGLIYNRNSATIRRWANQKNDTLFRQRKAHKGTFSFLGLRNEYRTGLLLIAMVNLLLLLNNVIDMEWIWFNFELAPDMTLRQWVHEGTYLLITSILLAMGIMLYFFRGNQHFYRPKGLLHRLSYVWIAQNVILVISVALRNYHYIAYHGLAYKRIGVFFFLALTLFGLWTIFLKIRDTRSSFFLFRTNGWAVYGMALLLCGFNWDLLITRYNLTTDYSGNLDTQFLLRMSDKTLPTLLQYYPQTEQKIRQKMAGSAAEERERTVSHYRNQLLDRVEQFQLTRTDRSWLSWNWPAVRTRQYLAEFPLEQLRLSQGK